VRQSLPPARTFRLPVRVHGSDHLARAADAGRSGARASVVDGL
jgi:hypothetical protein